MKAQIEIIVSHIGIYEVRDLQHARDLETSLRATTETLLGVDDVKSFFIGSKVFTSMAPKEDAP